MLSLAAAPSARRSTRAGSVREYVRAEEEEEEEEQGEGWSDVSFINLYPSIRFLH